MLVVNVSKNCSMALSSSVLLMCLKVLIFRGNALIYIKGLHIFTGLLSHHHSLSPRYTFHVLKNSIAPSPLVRARHLDRLEPFSRDRWIKEWRSLRGGGQVKHSRLSTSTSSTLEAPVDIYPQSPTTSDVVGDEFTLNVFSEKRPVDA